MARPIERRLDERQALVAHSGVAGGEINSVGIAPSASTVLTATASFCGALRRRRPPPAPSRAPPNMHGPRGRGFREGRGRSLLHAPTDQAAAPAGLELDLDLQLGRLDRVEGHLVVLVGGHAVGAGVRDRFPGVAVLCRGSATRRAPGRRRARSARSTSRSWRATRSVPRRRACGSTACCRRLTAST